MAPATERRKKRGKPAGPVDCEKCEHFTGRSGWTRVVWGCAKSHQPESAMLLQRTSGCDDYCEASREELLFRRYKGSASFHGDADLKAHQARATRTANGLSKALADFGDLMDGEQVLAGRQAVAALHRLADTLSAAAALAKSFKAREDAQREVERQRRGDALADQVLQGMSAEDVVECAELLASFDSSASMSWLDQRRGRRTIFMGGLRDPLDRVLRWQRAPADRKPEAFAEVRRELAAALANLNTPPDKDYATRADFDAFRSLQRDKRAAKASVAAVVLAASRPSQDEGKGGSLRRSQ